MVTLTQVLRSAWPVIFGLGLGLTACGGDDKKDEPAGGCSGEDCKAGSGFVQKAKDGKIVVDLKGVEKGAQFVLMPFLTGSVEGGNLDGTKFTFTAKSGAGAALMMAAPEAQAPELVTDVRALEHDRRALVAHFDPDRGLDQVAGFWEMARAVDENEGVRAAYLTGPVVPEHESLEAFYRKAAESHVARHRRAPLALTTTAGSCPSGTLVVPKVEGSDLKSATIPLDAGTPVVDGGDFCVVYVDKPITDADKASVEATVKAVVQGYKTTIYKNEMAPVGGYTFKPVVVVIDFKDSDHWPQSGSFPTLTGAFLPKMSEDAKQPMLYMMNDFSSLAQPPGGSDAALNKKFWHSTIAHEMEHAVLDYFRNWVASPKNPENVAIDEGIAHFMEDAWGYGEENFDSFAKVYLGSVAFGSTTFLNANSSIYSDRGASHALMYYLSSQKGGVKFDGGKISSGDGLAYITSVVTNATSAGAAGLAAKAGGDWTETLGNYLGALFVDGAISGAPQKYMTQGLVKGVADLDGNADKTFGMTFNGYRRATSLADVSEKLTDSITEEVTYYQTKPILFTVPGDNAQVTFTLPDGTAAADLATAAVSAVRVK